MTTATAPTAPVGTGSDPDAGLTIAGLVAAANQILSETPDPEWWGHTPAQVLAMAFPDWDIHALLDRAGQRRTDRPRALLRHRTNPDRWFLIWATGPELLPGRGSTMGQFFRFTQDRSRFALGTIDEVLADVFDSHHPDAQRGLCWWLLDTFATIDPDRVRAFPQAASWAVFTDADTHLRHARQSEAHGPTAPVGTHAALTCAFPDWTLCGLFEGGTTKALGLLHQPATDRWLFLYAYGPFLLAPDTQPGDPVLRAGEAVVPHTRGTLATADELIAAAQANRSTFPTDTSLWWLLHRLATIHPDPATARTYRDHLDAERTVLALLPEEQRTKLDAELRVLLTTDPLGAPALDPSTTHRRR